MSFTGAADSETRRLALDVAKRLQERDGLSKAGAWKALARLAHLPPGTIENLARKRLKGLRGNYRDALLDVAIRDLRTHIRGLEHDLGIALKLVARPDADEIIEARAALEAGRETLRRLMDQRGARPE